VIPLDVHYDVTSDVVTVEGTRFSGSFFRHMSLAPAGVPFVVVAREDGVVYVERFPMLTEVTRELLSLRQKVEEYRLTVPTKPVRKTT